MKTMVRQLLFHVMVVSAPLSSLGQQVDWSMVQYDMSNGLPQSSVLRVAVDSLGYAWLSTEAGLVRFDGVRMRYMPPLGGSKGNEDRMRDLLRTANGGIIATDVAGNRFGIHAEYLVIPIADHLVSPQIHGGVPATDLFLRMFDPATQVPRRDDWPSHELWMLPLNAHDWCVRAGDSLLWYKDLRFIRAQELPKNTRAFLQLGKYLFAIDGSGRSYRFQPDRCDPVVSHNSDRIPDGDIFWRAGDHEAVVFADHCFFLIEQSADGSSLSVERLPLRIPEGLVVTDAVWDDGNAQLLVGTLRNGLLLYRRTITSLLSATTSGAPIGGTSCQLLLGGDSVLTLASDHRAIICTTTGCSCAPGFAPCSGSSATIDPPRERILYRRCQWKEAAQVHHQVTPFGDHRLLRGCHNLLAL